MVHPPSRNQASGPFVALADKPALLRLGWNGFKHKQPADPVGEERADLVRVVPNGGEVLSRSSYKGDHSIKLDS